MRILFTGIPAMGHIVPLLPFAAAAAEAGHDTALVTGAELAPFVQPLRLLAAGPSQAELMAEASRRQGGQNPAEAGPAAIEYFAGTRIDFTYDEALERARSFGPDLLIADAFDIVGQMVAAALAVPWAALVSTRSLPESPRLAMKLWLAMEQAVTAQYARRSLTPTTRIALLDPIPELLQPRGPAQPADRIVFRPESYSQPHSGWTPPVFGGREDRPRVLVTLGTTIDAPATLATIASAVAAADVNVIVARGRGNDLDGSDLDRSRIRLAGFVPIAELLSGVDLVVSAAGAGTVSAALAAGLPLVLRPFSGDQPWNATQAARAGVAITITDSRAAGAAVTAVLSTPSYAAAARSAAAAIAAMDPPQHALRVLLDRV